ncbi:MAG TPA: elongation factor G, partial [Chloroflexota bacterium]|nr:elongation factor G [Chloroflexota bacterium]
MKSYSVEKIRNVGLFSHGGHGKTTLAEAMLFNAGAINRLGRADDGTTASDYDPEEAHRHISVQLALLPLEWSDTKINLIDSPGYADFLGEVLEAMRVVDGALVLFEAVSGVEVGAERAWKYAAARNVPRMIVISKMDRENADFNRTLDQVVAKFGQRVVPIQLPIGAQESFQGVVDLIAMKAYTGPDLVEGDVPAELRPAAEAAREKLIEAAAEGDDELLSKYLDGNELAAEEIRHGLRQGVLSGTVFPALCTAALPNKAIRPILDAIVSYFPSPAARGAVPATDPQTSKKVEAKPTADAPLSALVFKSTADPYVGKLSYFRVFSGTLHSDSHVWNASRGHEERLGQLFIIHGKTQEPVTQLGPGELGAVAKLQDAGINDTLSSREHPLVLDPIEFPDPLLTMAVLPKTKADLDKLGSALGRLAEEDPTIRIHKDPDTAETLMDGLGESHLDIAGERMHRKFGVEVVLSLPRVPFKETVLGTARAEYKHKKQTGGHGQYGHVFLEIEPLSRGAGFEFAERVVGGSVPKNYIPAVEKGVREALPEGALAGFPVVDVKVTLFDGSFHAVDSSEIAFKIAAAQAFRKCIDQARPVLLEPVVDLTVTVPEQYVGDVMGDLNTRRARVHGMFPQEDGLSVIQAQAPLAEVQRYATDLRSLTQGRGVYSAKIASYEEVPAHVAPTIIAEAKKER